MSLTAAATATAVSTPQAPPPRDRRSENRQGVGGALWMIDHHGATVLPCRCMDMSDSGMRLRVPLGYGVAEGQRYELRSHLPGVHPVSPLGVTASRWATVVRTEVHLGGDQDHLDVGVILDSAHSIHACVS
jgi:hypothetical protein